ncbi:homocysteine S-methyltransferase family protein [Knoellia sp. CPCC 206435]|uniref:homocysteine S-methyltransferase family protein n=1 Tax=Knoellia terrae TaxID=3404797 RepID=UPI003B42A632
MRGGTASGPDLALGAATAPSEPARPRAQWVTDAGLETDLIHHHGVDLPMFAAYPLLSDPHGRSLLTAYYSGFADVARAADAGLLLETPTWRASPEWVAALGGSLADVLQVNFESIVFLAGLAENLGASGRADLSRTRVVGVIGPRGDGYVPGASASADELGAYHAVQVGAFAEAGAERVTAYTLTTVAEAVGIVQTARDHAVEVTVSFTVETDGRLPDGTSLDAAVEQLWRQARPDGLVVNCAHPSHVAAALDDGDSWTERVTGLRVNASRQSHAELDGAEVLDEGNLADLVAEHRRLEARLPRLEVVGGCCGTDVRHVAALWGVDDPSDAS